MNNEKIIAIIPARGGSKRIKRKILRNFIMNPLSPIQSTKQKI